MPNHAHESAQRDPQSAQRVEDRHGHAQFQKPARDVALITYVGGATGPIAARMQAEVDAQLAEAGSLALFVDADALVSYTPEFRKTWTAWLGDHRQALRGCHILFKSSLVRMGVSIVNPLIGGFITPYSERSAFEKALAQAVGSTSRR